MGKKVAGYTIFKSLAGGFFGGVNIAFHLHLL
jgi:hypothetical protein